MIPVLLAVAATMQLFTFTVPHAHSAGVVGGYILQRGNARNAWAVANYYANASGAPFGYPKAPGARESLWVSITSDPLNALGWRNGGQALRLWFIAEAYDPAIAPAGYVAAWRPLSSPYTVKDTLGPSSLVIGANALPDTLVTDAGRSWARPVSGTAWLHRALEDGALDVGPLFTQEGWQMAHRDTICRLFNYVGLAGQRVVCAGPMP